MIVYGQGIIDDLFNVYLYNNFEANTTGAYNMNEWRSDWNNPPWNNRAEETIILQNSDTTNPSKVMRWDFPEGTYGVLNAGGQWESPLEQGFNELYFSFDVKFKPGFEWVISGKLPGVKAGETPGPGIYPDFEHGSTASLMWNSEGNLYFYSYHHDRPQPYGDGVKFNGFQFETNKWYRITMRVVINTVGETIGHYNGILEGYVDGVLYAQRTNLRFRNLSSIRWDKLKIYSAFGGSGDEFATIRDEWIIFDNFIVFTYTDNIDVPRGNVASSPDRILLHPLDIIDDSEWKQSLKATPVTGHINEITWDDYPIPATYTLYRKPGNEQTYQSIGTFDYNVNHYIDEGLTPATTYNYRISADDSLSNSISVTTYEAVAPQPPSNLINLSVNKKDCSVRWNDNSDNELGFDIERYTGTNGIFALIHKVGYNQTDYTDVNLLPDTDYSYRVRSYNEDGTSGYSNTIHIKTLKLQPPAAPSNLRTSNVRKYSVSLNWNDNSNNENNFILLRSTSPDNGFNPIATISANSVSYTDDNLLSNTTYYYRIYAVNTDGNSNPSNSLEVKTLEFETPAIPGNLRSSELTKTSVLISWNDNSDNEIGFRLYQSVGTNKNYQQISTITNNQTNRRIINLSPHTKYFYRILAYNNDGASELSNELEVNTLPFYAPETPSGLSATNAGKTYAILNWVDNSIDETHFNIYRSLYPSSDFELIGVANSNQTVFNDVELTSNTTYYYMISAVNEAGESDVSNILEIQTAITSPPITPTDLEVANNSFHSVQLIWDDNSLDETGFEIERSENNNVYSVIDIIDANETEYFDTNVVPLNTYYYRVRALNEDGYSGYTNIITALVNAKPEFTKPHLFVEEATEDHIELRWNINVKDITIDLEKANAADSSYELVHSGNSYSSFIDYNTILNHTYYYKVIARDDLGNFIESNVIEVTAISDVLSQRVREGLIAEYSFTLVDIENNVVRDISAYDIPLNLYMSDSSNSITKSNSKITFVNNSYIKSTSPARKIISACKETNELSIECWLKPEELLRPNSNIISLVNSNNEIGFCIGQEAQKTGNKYNYRYYASITTLSTAQDGAPKFYLDHDFDYLTMHHIVLTRNLNGEEKFFLNGQEISAFYRPSNFGNWKDSMYLFLGNDIENNAPWSGSFYHFAIYNRELSAEEIESNFNLGPFEELVIPENEFDVIAYPNPSTGIVNFNIIPVNQYDYGGKLIIKLTNILGIPIYQETILDSTHENYFSFDLSGFQSGMYILYIMNENAIINTRRISLIK